MNNTNESWGYISWLSCVEIVFRMNIGTMHIVMYAITKVLHVSCVGIKIQYGCRLILYKAHVFGASLVDVASMH